MTTKEIKQSQRTADEKHTEKIMSIMISRKNLIQEYFLSSLLTSAL